MKDIILDLQKAQFTQKENKIEIKIKKNVPEPKMLYKYYSLSDYSLKGLKSNTLYFSHSHLSNDVMDGNFMLWDFEDFIKQFNKDQNIDENDTRILNELKGLTDPFLKHRGLLSLSDTYNNELIWVHYTNENGYCLEFETKKLKTAFQENRNEGDCYFFPISYGELRQINFNDFITRKTVPKNLNFNKIEIDANLPIVYCFAQKDKFWDYENEWRFLLKDRKFNSISFPITIINDEQKSNEDSKKSGGNIEIPKDVVSKIILAPLFFNNSRFNKVEYDDQKTILYNFKENPQGKLVKEFLETLRRDFSEKIYQIDKVIENKTIVREIKYKIEIIDIGSNFINLNKMVIIKNGR